MFLKGYKIRGFIPVDLPSNWISLHAWLSDKKIKFYYWTPQGEVDKIAEKMLEGKKGLSLLVFLFNPFDILVAPITLAYFFLW